MNCSSAPKERRWRPPTLPFNGGSLKSSRNPPIIEAGTGKVGRIPEYLDEEEAVKRYCIKSRPNRAEYLDVLNETDDGYKIRLTRLSDGDEKIREDFIDRHLFDMCLKTGYLYELANAEIAAAAIA
jgi:hypothetical protein